MLELQWGRRSSSTETRGEPSGEHHQYRFNGAVDLHRRRQGGGPRRRRQRGASMGPSIFIDGDDGRLSAPLELSVASMGPSIFIDGDASQTMRAARGGWLQWGRRSSSTETASFHTRARAAAELQWGRRSSSTETGCRHRHGADDGPCFNGAVDLHRRRPGCHWGDRQQWSDASMGPSIFIDGDEPAVTIAPGIRKLQWGRRSSSTETREHDGCSLSPACFNGAVDLHRRRRERRWPRVRSVLASMGPSIFIDGDTPSFRGSCWRFAGFNGAVDLHRRRHERRPAAGIVAGRFNGAVDLHRRRRLDSALECSGNCASMGPSIFIDADP